MYLSCIRLWNFRKYGSKSPFDINTPSLEVQFKKGMNVLVGENDSGKTAIIDAIKLILKTQDYEWLRVTNDDFYEDTKRFRIELYFDDLKDDEAKNFTEWLCYSKKKDDNGEDRVNIYLKLIYDVLRNDEKIFQSDVCAGADEQGSPLTAEAKEYLKVTYLKPLRDAAAELTPGRYSRLANILYTSDVFQKGNKNTEIQEELNTFNEFVKVFFKEESHEGYKIKTTLDEFLHSFMQIESESEFIFSQTDLKSILSKLELGISNIRNPGLGSLNRLYMAAELLNLRRTDWDGVKLCLVEELEAHLHPQAQMKVIEKLQNCSEKDNIQFILTTHSPNLSSKLHIENLILCHNSKCYPMGEMYTQLNKNDYCFLEKFLDVTKSNLFFAKGIIFVEGWAEELFIPSFANLLKEKQIIQENLTEAGVVIINVGSTAFLRYTKIFRRKDNSEISIPIAIITDSDVKEYEEQEKEGEKTLSIRESDTINTDYKNRLETTEKEYNYGSVIKVFLAKNWTFEYALYKSSSLGMIFRDTVKNIHPQIVDYDFEKELAKKLIHQSLNKTGIAYSLSEKICSTDFSTVTKEQLESDVSISYLVEAVKFVCK